MIIGDRIKIIGSKDDFTKSADSDELLLKPRAVGEKRDSFLCMLMFICILMTLYPIISAIISLYVLTDMGMIQEVLKICIYIYIYRFVV